MALDDQGGNIDTSTLKPPVEWPRDKCAEFLAWRKADPARDKQHSFAALRAQVRAFLAERYPADHAWAKRRRPC